MSALSRSVILIAALSSSSATAQTKALQVVQAKVSFTIKHGVGTTATGTFSPLTVDGMWDPASLAASVLKGSVPAASINTGLGVRDRALQKPDYLDVMKYPTIMMDVRQFASLGNYQYQAQAKLSIKAVQKQIPIRVSAKPLNTGAVMLSSSFRISRLDFGVGESSWLLNDSLTVNLEATVKP